MRRAHRARGRHTAPDMGMASASAARVTCRPLRSLVASAALALALGCDASAPMQSPDAGSIEPAMLSAPETVRPIGPARCPEGWTRREDEGVAWCEPWDGAMPECPYGEHALPGRGCERIGRACPARGEWPDDLPSSGVVFVRADAEPGGDGTRERPLASLDDGMARARAGQTVAIAAGTYVVDSRPQGQILRGACVLDVILVPDGDRWTLEPWNRADGFDLELHDVTVRSPEDGLGLSITSDASARVEGCLFEAEDNAIQLESGGILELRDSRVTASMPTSGMGAYSLVVERTSMTAVDRQGAHLMGDDDFGVVPNGVASVRFTDVAIRGNGLADLRIDHSPASSVEFTRVAIEDASGVGVFVTGSTTTLTIRDVSVRGVRRGVATTGAADAVGIISLGAMLDVQGAYLSAVQGGGLEIIAVPEPDGSLTPGTGRVEDLVVREHAFPDRPAVAVNEGSTATFSRIAVLGGQTSVGLGVGPGARVVASDLCVRDIARDSLEYAVYGVVVLGGTLELTRAHVSGVAGGGIHVQGGSATVSDLRVVDVRAAPGGGSHGAVVQSGTPGDPAGDTADGSLVLSRVEISGAHGFGALALGPRASLMASDIRVSGVGVTPGDVSPGDAQDGVGAAAGLGARLSLERFALLECTTAGLMHVEASSVVLTDGDIMGNAFGITSGVDVPPPVLQRVRIEAQEQIPYASTTQRIAVPPLEQALGAPR